MKVHSQSLFHKRFMTTKILCLIYKTENPTRFPQTSLCKEY